VSASTLLAAPFALLVSQPCQFGFECVGTLLGLVGALSFLVEALLGLVARRLSWSARSWRVRTSSPVRASISRNLWPWGSRRRPNSLLVRVPSAAGVNG